MGGCVDNQFFRHENSLSLAVARRLPGRIAAVRVPLAVREGKSVPRVTGTHAGRTDTEAAMRSLLMGNRLFLKLTRLVRSRLAARGTADDAVLTLAILSTQSCLIPGIGKAVHRNLLQGLIDEAAK